MELGDHMYVKWSYGLGISGVLVRLTTCKRLNNNIIAVTQSKPYNSLPP